MYVVLQYKTSKWSVLENNNFILDLSLYSGPRMLSLLLYLQALRVAVAPVRGARICVSGARWLVTVTVSVSADTARRGGRGQLTPEPSWRPVFLSRRPPPHLTAWEVKRSAPTPALAAHVLPNLHANLPLCIPPFPSRPQRFSSQQVSPIQGASSAGQLFDIAKWFFYKEPAVGALLGNGTGSLYEGCYLCFWFRNKNTII